MLYITLIMRGHWHGLDFIKYHRARSYCEKHWEFARTVLVLW